MTAQKLTIDYKPIENSAAEEGLNTLLNNDSLKRFHDGDSNVTEKELGELLDIVNAAQNEITREDRAVSGVIYTNPERFTALVKEYQSRFPQGTKKISSNFFLDEPNNMIMDAAPPPQNSVNGPWAPKDLLSPDVLNVIRNKEQMIIGGLRVYYDSQYQMLRINNAHGGNLAFNLRFDEEGRISRISRDDSSDRGKFTQAVIDLESDGIFLPGAAQRLGISPEDILKAAESQKLETELAKINTSDLDTLSSSFEYPKSKRTLGVLQGDARFLDPSGKIDGLYTMGAADCAILIAVSKSPDGHVANVGMAHIDDRVKEKYIHAFFSRLNQNDPNRAIEIYVISGNEEIAFRVLKASQNANATIKFFNADFDGQRWDAAIVDRKGRVYYGFRKDFEDLFDPKELELLKLTRSSSDVLNFR